MKIKETIGIDVSKKVLDVCLYSRQLLKQFKNNNEGFQGLILWVVENSIYDIKEMLFALEHTGMYSDLLAAYLNKSEYYYSIIPGLEIKRSLGITRGKNDEIDAKRIALYAYRLREELIFSKEIDPNLKSLKHLVSLRKKLVRQRAGFVGLLKEQKCFYKENYSNILFEVQDKMILELTNQILKIEKEMKKLVRKNEVIENNFLLLKSIKGIGDQTAIVMLIYTDNFTKFETWRKFASYSGVAPFQYRSGSSVRGKSKVSYLANKSIKSLLNMCAITSIQYDSEMKQFYERRVEEGKNKMSTINIIRNKLIARMFAVIKRQTPYVDTMKFAV